MRLAPAVLVLRLDEAVVLEEAHEAFPLQRLLSFLRIVLLRLRPRGKGAAGRRDCARPLPVEERPFVWLRWRGDVNGFLDRATVEYDRAPPGECCVCLS